MDTGKFDKALKDVDAAAALADAEGAARRFANMRRLQFDLLCDAAEAETTAPGEVAAMAKIRAEGPRALARAFQEEARFWRGRVGTC